MPGRVISTNKGNFSTTEKFNLDCSQNGIDWDDNSHIGPNFDETIYEAMKK